MEAPLIALERELSFLQPCKNENPFRAVGFYNAALWPLGKEAKNHFRFLLFPPTVDVGRRKNLVDLFRGFSGQSVSVSNRSSVSGSANKSDTFFLLCHVWEGLLSFYRTVLFDLARLNFPILIVSDLGPE